ncbi:uncharacterized protein LOC130962257 isoform X2 [Arachis stenosperma]|uniref:uncharacterized protein LOC130962257 isoform X2 n=1 Tax=Arachis stenosperma TaxID=217475 RepID=UPI0025AC0DAE|nr:uncharacterized protein LOC130962257 isoform X2 [Arachis stenosperma]
MLTLQRFLFEPIHKPFLLNPPSSKTPSFQQHRVWRTRIIKGAIAELEGDLELPPNAVRRKRDPNWRGGFSLGIDLGMARTGLALTKGFNIRPLTVLELRGQKLELKIINIAEQQEADEFIIGLPRSSDGKETPQSNIVRSVAGRLAVRAAERGWRVYLQDEHGTTTEAVNRMITMGLSKSSQHRKLDAYAAMAEQNAVLKHFIYFSSDGIGKIPIHIRSGYRTCSAQEP